MATTSSEFDYKNLLSRAKKELPEPTSSGERWETPQADVMNEGRATVLRNWNEILEKVRREPNHLLTYLLRELGTAGDQEGDRVLFQGNLSPRNIQEKLNTYVQTYVICTECGRPDTILVKQERTTLLRCEACGAHKPIVARRSASAKSTAAPKPTLVEGRVYEMMIKHVSPRGDGVAEMFGITVYVPKTRGGDQVRVFVEKVSGHVAFGRVQP